MDWIDLLQLPATVLLVAGAVLLLAALVQGFATRRRLRQRRRLAAGWRLVLLLVFAALGLVVAGSGLLLRGYRVLDAETPVLAIDARQDAPQRWTLTLTWPDGRHRDVALAGDAWRVEAVVLKWQLPAVLAGVPPLYRLDRLSGRYRDPMQEREDLRTVIGLDGAGRLDLPALRRRYPRWLPMVDTVYGSGAWLPLVDGGHYQVNLMRTGALVARSDDATANHL